ncbi:cytochrome P450 [Rhizobium sp. NFR03]|uniref:cytochrome P450 n=1 Tax=Rhizobium sp. NFR03 TaxID=1566263 RepID=UPI0008B2EDCF|nr:cytochrome P450 [Rhizobium sp. NFR03]SES45755.1 Cytochrome P450 [Rhizobium sp. NFR03]
MSIPLDSINVLVPPYSHELNWPKSITPYQLIDADGAQGEPYAHYAWLRENAPVMRVAHGDLDVWIVTRYDDVRAALRRPKLFQSQVTDNRELAFITAMDDPDHARLRQVVASAFTPKVIASVESQVRQTASKLLDDMIAVGGGEVVGSLARPLTMTTISKLVGLPVYDLDQVNHWCEQTFVYFARLARNAPGSENDEKDAQEFFHYVNGHLRRLHKEGSQSVGGSLARAWLDDGIISEKEATELCAFVFIAGFETSTRLIAGSLLELHYNPILLERLRVDPEAPRRFVEELVRMRGPTHRSVRRTASEVEIGGYLAPRHTLVRLMIASANRDDAVWPDGDKFNIDRDPTHHFGFGYGIHGCLGAPLARIEMRILAELFGRKLKRVTFDPHRDLVFLKGNSMINGPETLRIDIQPLDGAASCPFHR